MAEITDKLQRNTNFSVFLDGKEEIYVQNVTWCNDILNINYLYNGKLHYYESIKEIEIRFYDLNGKFASSLKFKNLKNDHNICMSINIKDDNANNFVKYNVEYNVMLTEYGV